MPYPLGEGGTGQRGVPLIWGCSQKLSDWVDNKIYAYDNKHSLRSNTKCYGGKSHYTDSRNSDTTAPSGRELYHLQLSLQAISPETFGYTLVKVYIFLLYRSNKVTTWSRVLDSHSPSGEVPRLLWSAKVLYSQDTSTFEAVCNIS
jgi:hypothetical protein